MMTPEQKIESLHNEITNTKLGTPLRIRNTAAVIHRINVSKGFYDTPRNTGEMLMLVVSELSEALEADRASKIASFDWEPFEKRVEQIMQIVDPEQQKAEYAKAFREFGIKDSFQDEIADAIIRLLDISEGMGIDIERHILAKMKYNATRPRLHGKKY